VTCGIEICFGQDCRDIQVLIAGTSEINIEEQAKQLVSEQTVAKVQAELESKV
jgi:hypothetical protein